MGCATSSGGGGSASDFGAAQLAELEAIHTELIKKLNENGTVNAKQSGVWTTGRTWDLNFATDQVDISGSSVSVSNFPASVEISNDVGNPIPVSGPLTDTQLRAVAVPVSGPLTDSQLRASAVPVSGPLTDAQLRATAVPVSGTVAATQSGTWTTARSWDLNFSTDQVDASGSSVSVSNFPSTVDVSDRVGRLLGHVTVDNASIAVTGPLTDTQLRAATVHVTVDNSSVAVTGPLTDTQLRATPVPVSGSFTGSGTFDENLKQVNGTTQTGRDWSVDFSKLDVALSTRLKPADTLAAVTTVAAVTAITNALPAGSNTIGKVDQGTGGASAWKVDGSAVTQPVSGPLTDTQLRASAVPVSGPLTDTQLRATPVPVSGTVTATPASAVGTLANGVETAIAATAVQVLAANASRKAAIVQNTGLGLIRVGIAAVAATTGVRLGPGDIAIFKNPFVHTGAIFAIRDGATSSLALGQEIN